MGSGKKKPRKDGKSEPEGREKEQPGHTLKETHPEPGSRLLGRSLGLRNEWKRREGCVPVHQEEGWWQEPLRKE